MEASAVTDVTSAAPEPALFVTDDELHQLNGAAPWAGPIPRGVEGLRGERPTFPQNPPVVAWPVSARGARLA